MIGKSPNAAPSAVESNACPAGMLYTAIATISATASEMSAAHCAFIFTPPSSTNSVMSGSAAKMDDTPSELLTGS